MEWTVEVYLGEEEVDASTLEFTEDIYRHIPSDKAA